MLLAVALAVLKSDCPTARWTLADLSCDRARSHGRLHPDLSVRQLSSDFPCDKHQSLDCDKLGTASPSHAFHPARVATDKASKTCPERCRVPDRHRQQTSWRTAPTNFRARRERAQSNSDFRDSNSTPPGQSSGPFRSWKSRSIQLPMPSLQSVHWVQHLKNDQLTDILREILEFPKNAFNQQMQLRRF